MKRNNYLLLTNDGIIEAYGFAKANEKLSIQVMDMGVYLIPDRCSGSLTAINVMLESSEIAEKRIIKNEELYRSLKEYGYKTIDFIYSEESDSYISI